jgi:hypothetical protein
VAQADSKNGNDSATAVGERMKQLFPICNSNILSESQWVLSEIFVSPDKNIFAFYLDLTIQ